MLVDRSLIYSLQKLSEITVRHWEKEKPQHSILRVGSKKADDMLMGELLEYFDFLLDVCYLDLLFKLYPFSRDWQVFAKCFVDVAETALA